MSRRFRVYAPRLINSSEPSIHAEHIEWLHDGGPMDRAIKYIEIEAVEIGDEYHTMHELYAHRMALNAALFNSWYKYVGEDFIKVMKSKQHYDGTMFEGGYFIVMAITEHGQISYHYKLKCWDIFQIPEVERTPSWDGHGSIQVLERLLKLPR